MKVYLDVCDFNLQGWQRPLVIMGDKIDFLCKCVISYMTYYFSLLLIESGLISALFLCQYKMYLSFTKFILHLKTQNLPESIKLSINNLNKYTAVFH